MLLKNNGKGFKIWESLEDPYDYETFAERCTEHGIIPMTEHEFVQKVGIITAAKRKNKDLSPEEAYRKYASENTGYPPGCQNCNGENILYAHRGLGDTVASLTHAVGLDKLSELYTKITGKPCGCKDRQEALNKLFPYGIKGEFNESSGEPIQDETSGKAD